MSKNCVNSEDEPGLLIWHCGRADMAGSWTHHGILYMVNNSDGTCPASLPQRGNGTCSDQPSVTAARTWSTRTAAGASGAQSGSTAPGCIKLGSNGLQVSFDGSVFDSVRSFGAVGLVQNTWRELDPQVF